MTVHELIDALNKVEDKSKPVNFDYLFLVKGIEEGDEGGDYSGRFVVLIL